MRDNKFLQQQAETEKQQILEERKNQNYAAMLDRIESAPKKQSFWRRYSKWLISAAGVAASTIILVCVFVFYPFADNTVLYLEDNFEVQDSTVDEMDADMGEYEFNLATPALTFTVNKTIDKISGDILFYTVKTTSVSQIRLTLVAVCNPNYTYKNFEMTKDFFHTEIPNYSITYVQTATNSGGLTRLSARAKIQRNKEIIYLTDYQEYLLDRNRTIIDIIQEMFI